MYIDLIYSFQNKMLLQQQHDIQRKQLKYALTCLSFPAEDGDVWQQGNFISALDLYFAFYIFISGTGNECRDFSSPPEIKKEKMPERSKV